MLGKDRQMLASGTWLDPILPDSLPQIGSLQIYVWGMQGLGWRREKIRMSTFIANKIGNQFNLEKGHLINLK